MTRNARINNQLIIYVLFLVTAIITVSVLIAVRSRKEPDVIPQIEKYANDDYTRGVNAALDAIMLLSLEQDLEGTNRTWGLMADIVRSRLHVENKSR